MVIGFAILGLGQIVFGKKKENETKELREKLQKTKNELCLAQGKLKNREEKEVRENQQKAFFFQQEFLLNRYRKNTFLIAIGKKR